MSGIDPALIRELCHAATGEPPRDILSDQLDGSVWVSMASWPRAQEALKALNAHGIGGRDHEDCRLHVTGWDARLLRWRLGVVLAGVDDLKTEWDATAEMVRYHHDRRVDAGLDPDPAEILADVEDVMRGCVPIPHQVPQVQDIDSLLELIAAAEDAYQQLIAEHVDYAERVLARHITKRLREGAA